MRSAHFTKFILALLALSVGMLSACSDKTTEAPQPRKILPMEGFKDFANVESKYADSNGNLIDLTSFEADGAALVTSYREGQRCANCHALPGSNATMAPSLLGVGARYRQSLGGEAKARIWLHNKIWDTSKFPGLSTNLYGRSDMPLGKALFSEDEIKSIVAYLVSLK